MLANMVTLGNRVADVGCDHGFLSVYLVREGISPRVIAMDVRSGPLSAAREHIGASGLGSYIETRLSDGLQELRPGETDAVVCAGMGGRLMARILEESLEKARGMRELILQPQSQIKEFRQFLRGAGFQVTAEDMVREDGTYYVAMRAVPGEAERGLDERTGFDRALCDRFGEILLSRRHPLLGRYLLEREKLLEKLTAALAERDGERIRKRFLELQEELDDVRRALALFAGESLCAEQTGV